MTRLRLKPYEDPMTGERLRGSTAFTYVDTGGWALRYRRRPTGPWLLFDRNLTALGVLRQFEWLLRDGYGAEFKVVLT